jgi:hypothetical protein
MTSQSKCQCPIAGWCEAHQRYKSEKLFALCQSSPTHRRNWEIATTSKTSTLIVASGAGTELTKLLHRFARPIAGCKCRKHAREMDENGTEWCRQNIEMIVGWLAEESRKRKVYPVPVLLRRIVILAIRRAEAHA